MQDFEKLGVFYLGREYDLGARRQLDDLLLYDSKDLVTHAVCVGMTGSGKTGLCLGLLEEAAIDGIPAIIIDPKGDLPNLLLTFPQLQPADFRPWVNEDEARRKGVSADDFAAQQAELWKSGLAKWGQDGARIKRQKESAEFVIYTPGSSAGLPVSILKSFAKPEPAIMDDGELLRERIATTATSLLGLLGIDADPIQSREHILLSGLLGTAWAGGKDMDLAALVAQIQQPPMAKIGVMDLESFYPSKDRFALAMRLNNLLAAPGFGAWMEGAALDIQSILYTPAGKPRVAIFSIAHLGDAERMFFVSLLLNQMLGWMRGQSGTTSLRALLYMDEIFGYFPPVANPPSKQPLLTLLKQARAYGLGVVLATQNPVDLDYKGLSNCGTWFIGRLQTDRDKQRVLDGLEGAAAGNSGGFDRAAMEQTLAGLGSRVFLMNNVHDDKPVTFETRWCMSYLRGPMTRNQIKQLMDPVKSGSTSIPLHAGAERGAAPAQFQQKNSIKSQIASDQARPVLPPDVPQFFLPLRQLQPDGTKLIYRPVLLGTAKVFFANTKAGITADTAVAAMTSLADGAIAADFNDAETVEISEGDLEKLPADGAAFAAIPSEAAKAKSYAVWKKSFADWLYRTQQLEILSCPPLKITSKNGESERDFRARLQQKARELRDEFADKLRTKFAAKYAALNERIRKAEQAVEREKAQSQSSTIGAVLSVGTSILGAFLGRKKISAANVGRAGTAARSVSRSYEQKQDVNRAEENVEAAQQELARVEEAFNEETAAHAAEVEAMVGEVEAVAVKPKKTDITVRLLGLAWAPHYESDDGTSTAAWK
jgi:hypothetical protein